MLWKKDNPDRNRQLDQLGRRIIRASQATEKEIETAISSPALLERIRARAATVEARPAGTINNWSINSWVADILAAPRAVAWSAIPALALVAAVALAFWMSATSNPADKPVGGTAMAVEVINSEPQLAPVTACSVATKEECAVSTDDAVAILVSASAKETNR